MDHGVVWITYRPDLPEQQMDKSAPLRQGELRHRQPVPRPGRARHRHLLEGPAEAERRRTTRASGQFVNQFKVSELAPLSGNRCTIGVGRPAA